MSDSPAGRSRAVVFVLGMHRSGTSVTTAILNALGVSLSEDLMPPTQFNAMGYFESVAISKIHDGILTALGSSWKTSELFVPFPKNWWMSAQIAPFKRQLITQVKAEMDRIPDVWGFKDPRTARLLPLWKDIVAEIGLEPRYVLVVRDPQDVARSLQTRESVHPVISELLWLEHYAGAISQIGKNLHAIVEYGRWFEEPMEQAEYMIRALGCLAPPKSNIEEIVHRVVSSDLRHHKTLTEGYALPYSRDLYHAMKRRDIGNMELLAQLFEVTKAFGNTVAGLVQQNMHEQLTTAQFALQQSAVKIAALECEAASLRSVNGVPNDA